MTNPTFTTAFVVQDADTHITAQLFQADGQCDADSTSVVISHPDRDGSVILSIADFRRMVAAIDRAIDLHVA